MTDTDRVPGPPQLPSDELELAEMVGRLAASVAHMSDELISLHETLREIRSETLDSHATLRTMASELKQIRHAEAVIADGVLKLRQDTLDLDARLATIEHMPSIVEQRRRMVGSNGE